MKSDSKFWFEMAGEKSDVIISSRVRLARNISDLPFPNMMSIGEKKDLVSRAEKAISDNNILGFPLRSVVVIDLKDIFLSQLVDNHIISIQFTKEKDGSIILSDDQSVAVMVGEEDHFRIQVFRPGLDLSGAYDTADKIDTALAADQKIAFDKELGYLTQCPTNLGTGMRASVMMHLPALESSGNMRSISESISKRGLTIRGSYGEGSKAVGSLYQISNQITLGITEKEIIDNLESIVLQIYQMERDVRNSLDKNLVEDSCYRSLGILKYARQISSEEMSELISTIRLGAAMGIIEEVDSEHCNRLAAIISPAAIMSIGGEKMSAQERDVKRASLGREILN